VTANAELPFPGRGTRCGEQEEDVNARLRLTFCATLIVTTLVASSALDATNAGMATAAALSTSYRDDTVLVGFQTGTTPEQEQVIVWAAGATDTETIGVGTHVLNVAAGSVTATIAVLSAYPEVRYAEPDYDVQAEQTPDDPMYGQLWGLPIIEADQAWDATTGSAGIVVGVVDTGVDYTHPDLTANIWTNDGTVGRCPAGTHGYNALQKSCDPMDDHNHGTHVSGTIGAIGNNGVGVAGVNWNVRIMALKFLSASGYGSTRGAIAAIDWALKAKAGGVNLRVLSNSWGGGGYSRALADEIDRAGAEGVLFVAAAGNSGTNNDTTPFYPCSYRAANEICVAATDRTDTLAGFSNYGASSVDLAAPGTSIVSTVIGGRYASFSGTSMATPHVSGAAALILSAGDQSVSTLKSTILGAVDPVASLAGRVKSGGRLDVCNAIASCLPRGAGFSLDATPSRQAVSPGDGTAYTVTITPTGGFRGTVALDVSGLPDGASASFSPNPLDLRTATSSTLSVTTSATTAADQYTLTLTGVSGGLTASNSVRLHVMRGAA
jgi:subtilisin family serine protease